MKLKTLTVLLAAGMALSLAAADLELSGPDGRRILLKDDGTWRYLDAKDKPRAKDAVETRDKAEAKGEARDTAETKDKAPDKPRITGEALLRLDRKTEIGSNCRFEVRLVNNLGYEIRSLVPTFSALRANGVIYDSVLTAFQSLRPGDSQTREIQFRGIPCPDITRVQVAGGDRCVMGELDRWGAADGQCLARVRVQASDLVRFDK